MTLCLRQRDVLARIRGCARLRRLWPEVGSGVEAAGDVPGDEGPEEDQLRTESGGRALNVTGHTVWTGEGLAVRQSVRVFQWLLAPCEPYFAASQQLFFTHKSDMSLIVSPRVAPLFVRPSNSRASQKQASDSDHVPLCRRKGRVPPPSISASRTTPGFLLRAELDT